MLGKEIRLKKILDPVTKKTLLVPIDHGMSDGPIIGLENVRETISLVSDQANAVIMHKGIVGQSIGVMNNSALIIHLSAGNHLCSDPLEKVIITSVEEAIALGADAVSVHINVGAVSTPKMLEDIGLIGRDCKRFGLPLIVMAYPRGEKVSNEKDVSVVKMVARIAAELGADIVKTNYTGSIESFKEVVNGCPVPVVIAGGSKGTDVEVLQMIKDAMLAGAKGVAMGRNSFQHSNPKKFLKAVSLIIHKNYSVEQAMLAVAMTGDGLSERIDNRCKTI